MAGDIRFYPRFLVPRVREAMGDSPVTLIAGPRQAGKTTLVRHLMGQELQYLTLDDATTLLAASQDPVGLVRGLDRAVIDEVQRASGLLLAIKSAVDVDRRPGRFLLTGSANLMTLPAVADSLAGRMETLTLLPLSQGEMRGSSVNWLDAVFAGCVPVSGAPVIGKNLVEAVLRGGYPEVVARATERRRTAWIRQYIAALIQRDVRDIAGVEKLGILPRFLRALASLSGQLCNYSQLGGQVGLDHKTAAKYLTVFEQMFLLRRVEPWAANHLKRVVKTPKLYFLDSGILSTLLGLTSETAHKDRVLFGTVLEAFVYGEILKHAIHAEGEYRLYHYRDQDQYEVDIVIEDTNGDIVGVEVKAGATLARSDLRGLKRLANSARKHFKMGIILYDGQESLPLGDGIRAAPVSSLWSD